MKILFISNIPSPYRIDFFNEVGKHVELTVVFEAKSANGIKFNWNIDQIENFEAIFLNETNPINEKKIDFSILKYIKRNKYDYIFVTNYAYLTEMFALLLLKVKKIPYIMEIDGGILKNESFFKRTLKKFLIRGAQLYVSPSAETDNFLKNYGIVSEKISRYHFSSIYEQDILSNVLTIEEKEFIKQKNNIQGKKIILGVGQFIPRKGFEDLIKISNKFDPEVSIYLIGGEPPEEYRKLIEKNNSKNVFFENFKSASKLREYYQSSDVFVLPTRHDVWGLVINEAMSQGLPVVTTKNCGAGLEMVTDKENGYLVEKEDLNTLFNSINSIINDDYLRYNMSRKSLKKIQKFTINQMARDHIDVFDQLNKKN